MLHLFSALLLYQLCQKQVIHRLIDLIFGAINFFLFLFIKLNSLGEKNDFTCSLCQKIITEIENQISDPTNQEEVRISISIFSNWSLSYLYSQKFMTLLRLLHSTIFFWYFKNISFKDFRSLSWNMWCYSPYSWRHNGLQRYHWRVNSRIYKCYY